MQKVKIEAIDINEALRYMGQMGEADGALAELMKKCEAELLRVIAPAFIYRVFSIEETEEGISVVGTPLVLRGGDIRAHLSGCGRAVLICATVGVGADSLIRKAEITDMTAAFALDALASAAVEQVCAKADEIIKDAMPESFFTWRFSPGYGDFPLETQKQFLNVMNAQKLLGLCLENSNILVPRKSVTAVSGMSELPLPKKKSSCAGCSMAESCKFRKRGDHCGF